MTQKSGGNENVTFPIKAKYRMIPQAAVVSPRCPLELGQVPTQQQHSRGSTPLEHGRAGQKECSVGRRTPKGERGSGPSRAAAGRDHSRKHLRRMYSQSLCGAGRPVLGIMGKKQLRGGLEQHLNYCTKSSVLAKGPRELLWAPE